MSPQGTQTLDVVVVGDLMVDVVAVMSGPLAQGSDTPSQITTTGGGSGANVAAWLAHQGVPTSYIGRVGADPLGRQAVDALTDTGVHVWASADETAPTGTCIVLVEPGGERSMLPDGGANATLLPADVPPTAFRPGGHLHLSGYTLLSPGSRDAALTALHLAAASRMTVSVDPSSEALLEQAGPARFLEWTRGAHVLLANVDEAAVLSGSRDPHEAAGLLAETYREVVVKLGPGGALWQNGFITASAPGERGIDVIDTTGAGDAFAAGFLASWLLHPEPESALAAGNRLAARVVSQVGARP